jgi:DNA polymerase elongation subunit (family B)
MLERYSRMKTWKASIVLFWKSIAFIDRFAVLEGDTDELPVIIGETEQSLAKVEEIKLV